MKPRRILILDTGREWGGGTNSLLELLKRADRKRYSFSALFYHNYGRGRDSDIGAELERLGVDFTVLERASKRPCMKGLKEAGRALLFFSRDLRKRYVFNIDYLERILPDSKRIASFIGERGFDLLYMNNQPSSNLEGVLAASAAGVKCIQHSRIEVRLSPFEAEAVNNWVSKVICVSRGVMDGLVDSGVRAEKCKVVYNGIDCRTVPGRDAALVRRELGAGEDCLVIGSAGSLIKRKRFDVLLKAFSALKLEKARLIVVGDGPEMGRLKAMSKELGIEKAAVFTGFSTDPLSYMNAMDIFVLPSEKEGLPRVVLEAMLLGKPVIAFDVIGTRELVEDGKTGVLIREQTPEALAAGLKRLIPERKALREMGSAGRALVRESFGIDRYVSGVTGVFEEVLR